MARPDKPALTLAHTCPDGYSCLAQPGYPHNPAYIQASRFWSFAHPVLSQILALTLSSGHSDPAGELLQLLYWAYPSTGLLHVLMGAVAQCGIACFTLAFTKPSLPTVQVMLAGASA